MTMADERDVVFLFSRESKIARRSIYSYTSIQNTPQPTYKDPNQPEIQSLHKSQGRHFQNEDTNPDRNSNIVMKKKRNKYKRRNKYNIKQQQANECDYTILTKLHSNNPLINSNFNQYYSIPVLGSMELNYLADIKRIRSSINIKNKPCNPFNTNFTINTCHQTYIKPKSIKPFNSRCLQSLVYRCQLKTQEDSCCCSCNSDAMFEVMKSLYDCYKKKDCDNCNCILCGHLPREERRLGEERKSGVDIAKTVSTRQRKQDKIAQVKAAGLLSPLEGKTQEEKENILKGLAKSGISLLKAKTVSEEKLIKKVRTEVGLPPAPKTGAEKALFKKAKAAGVLTPLEGKSTAQKEKILRKQFELGIPLTEGRTASEKALINKIKAEGTPPNKIVSEFFSKAKAEGLMTPLQGKTPAQKKEIIRKLALKRLPFPEAKTESENEIIENVRRDLGLPPGPKTSSAKDKYQKALAAGLITPLEGKSSAQKEAVLRGQVQMGLMLPEGRTASEKALIAEVKATTAVSPPSEGRILTKRLRQAKASQQKLEEAPVYGKNNRAALLPEKAKQLDEKTAKIMKEGKGPSDECICGLLTPEPMKKKYAKTQAGGIITPLEGKTASTKEKNLRKQAEMGLPLPEGRTPSEKALIAKVKAVTGTRPLSTLRIPSEKLKRAKAAGLLTPLKGKTPEQKENIIKGLAMHGIPLPEGRTASEKKLIEKVRADVGLPPEPRTLTDRDRYNKALAAGIVTPLEGKSVAQKEKILRGQLEMGLPLPEGRTPSEKALIAKVKATTATRPLSTVRIPSEKLKRAKAAGLLTPLEGKTPGQMEKIIRGLAMHGIPLPEGRTASEKKLIEKVRADVGLPPEPRTSTDKNRYNKALAAGIITPLEGKSAAQKEKILRGQLEMGLPLPEGRTPSEKALIAKVKATTATRPSSTVRIPSEKLKRAKAAGLLTPLEGKTPGQMEKIIRGLAMHGIPLPEGRTASEKKLIEKVRADVGLPPEPRTSTDKNRYNKALAAGIITPLEGKSGTQKEKILRGQAELGLALPEGRTPSEKALINNIKYSAKARRSSTVRIAPEKLQKAKAAGLLTPLDGKTKEQKEKILRGLVMHGIPLPDGKSASEKELIEKVLTEVGLPPKPKTEAAKEKYKKALTAGFITPLEGKSAAQKERILTGQAQIGLPLPEGRTASEKALIAKVKATVATSKASAKPLEGKTQQQKEKVLKGLAAQGLPLPEGETASEKKLLEKIRSEKRTYLPPEKNRKLDEKTAKVMKEGKGPSDECICGLLTPKSEKTRESPGTMSKKLKSKKAIGSLAPLEGKTPMQKEKYIKDLVKQGMLLPEARSASEKIIIDKVRAEMGLPPDPTTPSIKQKYEQAHAAGLITPLEGKTSSQKEKILKGQLEMGLPLPKGRTPSEKALIEKVRDRSGERQSLTARVPSEKLKRAKAAGLLTPLEGKTPEQREKIIRGMAMHGIPLPEGRTASEKKLIEKVRTDVGLPPEPRTSADKNRYNKALAAGIITPLEGKSATQKEKILREQLEMGLPLPKGRTPSEKALIKKVRVGSGIQSRLLVQVPPEKLKRAKAAGLLTPLEGKTPEQREKIIRGLAMHGIPLPEGRTASEKKLIEKVRTDVGLPPEPRTSADKNRYNKALAAGIITPLEGKSATQKEKILREQLEMGLPLPKGRTPSEKALIKKVRVGSGMQSRLLVQVPPEKLKRAKAAGLLTPLEGKTTEQREKIIRGLAMHGIPLPEGRTASEKKLIEKVRANVGLPPEPRTSTDRDRYNKALAAGIITPLEGKSATQKEKILRSQLEMDLPLPEGRTPSEKALIKKVRVGSGVQSRLLVQVPPEKLKRAKAAGLLTPLVGKTPEQREKIIRGLAMHGIPLPEGKTASEKKLIESVRANVGLPPEPRTLTDRDRYNKALAAGIITPLEGKSATQKEKILRSQLEMGLPLPEGRTPSEKALIAKVKATTAQRPSVTVPIPSEKLRRVKAAGLLTPLEGKTPEQREKIIRGLAMHGIPLPEGRTASEKKLIEKVRIDVGLPPEPRTSVDRVRYNKALAAGIITPLEGKSAAQKEEILRGQLEMGLPLPEGRTPSEKALIKKVRVGSGVQSRLLAQVPPEKLKRAKAAGFLTPLEGKTPEQREKIIRGLAMHGIPLPEGRTESEQKLIEKVRADVGLPPEPRLSADRDRYHKALAAGLITPLEGKSSAQKAKILREQLAIGLPLPEGRTSSERGLIKNIIASNKARPSSSVLISPEKLQKAKIAGLLTPLDGKTKDQKEKILRGLAMHGIPLPDGKTPSEKRLIDKIRADLGLPPEPKTQTAKERYKKALAAGLVTPLEGKSATQKEKVLRGQAAIGLTLPEGRTSSEKALIEKVKASTTEKRLPSRAVSPGLSALPAKEAAKLDKKTAKGLKEGAGPSDECICGLLTPESEREYVKRKDSMLSKAKISSEKLQKAKTKGFGSPLEGKTEKQKEKILKGFIDAGLPLPEGKTASEKKLIQKLQAASKLSPKPSRLLHRKQIKSKSTGVGATQSKRFAKGVGITKSKGGIVEEFEDIVKTTTCDRGCGCDKKKIRFKHSYVKIRVTSPDISSLCPCPEECVPGVKGGVLVDNEGIKVTVGTAICLPGYAATSQCKANKSSSNNVAVCDDVYSRYISMYSLGNYDTTDMDDEIYNNIYDILNKFEDRTNSNEQYLIQSTVCYSDSALDLNIKYHITSRSYVKSHKHLQSDGKIIESEDLFSYINSSEQSEEKLETQTQLSPDDGYTSVMLLRTESYLSLSTDSLYSELGTVSAIAFNGSTLSSCSISIPDVLSVDDLDNFSDNIEDFAGKYVFSHKKKRYYREDRNKLDQSSIEDYSENEVGTEYRNNTEEFIEHNDVKYQKPKITEDVLYNYLLRFQT